MKHYSMKIHVSPELRYGSLLGSASLPQALMSEIKDGIVSQYQPVPTGGEHLRLELSRPSDDGELLAEIEAAAAQVGYAVLEVEVEEFVDNAVRGALIGFCVGGGGGATTRNPLLTLIAAAIGAYAGERIGTQVRTLVATRHYQLNRNGRWIVTELPLAAPGQPTPQPDPSGAALLPA